MQLSHGVVTRGGANTTTEALHFGCPLIFHGFGGIMPQETLTVNYFVRHGAAARIHSIEEFGQLLDAWLDQGPAYQRVRAAMADLRGSDDAESVFQRWLALADEAQQGEGVR